MSSRMEDPPEGLALVDEDTLLQRLDEWSKNLHWLAKAICVHASVDAKDARDHNEWPCERCVKTVRHVTEYWFMALHTKARAAQKKAAREALDLPTVDLFEALFIASSLLDPCTSVQIEGWGAA